MKQSKGESGMEKTKEEKKGLFFRFINGVEVIGNKLPHPFYLFTILIVVAIVLSVIFNRFFIVTVTISPPVPLEDALS